MTALEACSPLRGHQVAPDLGTGFSFESARLSAWKFPHKAKNQVAPSPPKSHFTIDTGRIKVRDFAFEPSSLPPIFSYRRPSISRRKQSLLPSDTIALSGSKTEPNLELHIGFSRRKSPRQSHQHRTIDAGTTNTSEPTIPSPLDLDLPVPPPSHMRSASIKRKREEEPVDAAEHVRKLSRTGGPDFHQSFSFTPDHISRYPSLSLPRPVKVESDHCRIHSIGEANEMTIVGNVEK